MEHLKSFRVVGASRDTGAAYDEVLRAKSPDHAEQLAQGLGVLVSDVAEVATAESPLPPVPPQRRIPDYSAIDLVAQAYTAIAILILAIGAVAAISFFYQERPLWGILTIAVSLATAIIPLFCSAMLRCIRDLTINSWHIRRRLE